MRHSPCSAKRVPWRPTIRGAVCITASRLQEAGRYAEAAASFRACQALLPFDPAPWLNLSASLLAQGDVHGAIRAARRGCARGNLPVADYALGLACLEAGELVRAVSCFRQVARLAPGFADGWVNLGVAQYRAGEIGAARQAMQRALDTDPGNVAAAANLGSFMRLTGEDEAGEALLRDVLARRPDAAACRVNLAAALLQEDRAGEALALLDGAEPHGTALRQHWQLQKALALIKLSRLEAARTELERLGPVLPALAPLLHWRRALLAAACGDAGASRHQAGLMAAALDVAPAMLPEHRIMAHYDLAKLRAQFGEHDLAFAHWRAGHTLLRGAQPFSRTRFAAFVDATMASFDAARMAGGRAGNRDATPVFVVGMPRSGTTLLEQILSAHPQVHGAGERVALAAEADRLGGTQESSSGPRRIAALGAAALDAAASRYLRELHGLAPDASRIVDKMPCNFRHLGLVGLMLPGARIISCVRDPRDIGLSIFTYRFYGQHAYAHDLSDLGWYIAQQRRLMAHWQAVLPNPVLSVKLAVWIEDFSRTLRRVLTFLDLPYDAACEHSHESKRRVRTVSRAQVMEPINGRGLDRWKIYERHLAPLIVSLQQEGALP